MTLLEQARLVAGGFAAAIDGRIHDQPDGVIIAHPDVPGSIVITYQEDRLVVSLPGIDEVGFATDSAGRMAFVLRAAFRQARETPGGRTA